jgi:hypothetical protein
MIAFFLVCGTLQSVMAQTAKDIFNSSETPITYLGIDFTNAKLIGDPGADAIDIRNRYFSSINEVVINEPKKYDLQKALEKSNVSNDLSFVRAKNEKVDADKIKSSSSSDANRFSKSTIEDIVKGYNFGGKKGVGLMFIMESMDKTAKQGSMYVTFIDMASRKVILTERMTGEAGGFGFRNYWVKPVSDVIEKIQKRKYKEWKNAS